MLPIKVSIVIPCLNEENYIGNCIQSIFSQSVPLETIEVFVVDGGSTDQTRNVLAGWHDRWPSVRMIDNPQRYTPVALNLGIKASQGEVVIILGAHASLEKDFVERCLAALQEHPEAWVVGGILHHINENQTAEIIAKAMSSPFGVGNVRFRTGGQAGYVDTVAFGAYRSSVFEEIGYFDEELVRNQDDEFNFRITKNGGKIWFDPAIRSNYYVRSSYKKLFRQYLQYGYWKVYVNVKHATVTTGRQLVPAIFVLMLLVLLAGGLVFPLFRVASLWLLVVWFFAALAAVFFNHTRSAMIGGTLLTFFILHFSYGWGYLEGLLRFAILRKSPKSKKLQSTR